MHDLTKKRTLCQSPIKKKSYIYTDQLPAWHRKEAEFQVERAEEVKNGGSSFRGKRKHHRWCDLKVDWIQQTSLCLVCLLDTRAQIPTSRKTMWTSTFREVVERLECKFRTHVRTLSQLSRASCLQNEANAQVSKTFIPPFGQQGPPTLVAKRR